MEPSSSSCATGRHVGCRLETYGVPYSSSDEPATIKALQPKIGQNHLIGSGKWYLWTHKGKLLISTCISGWWILRLFAESKFYPILSKPFLSFQNFKRHPWAHQCLKSPMFTHQIFNLEKLECWDPPLTSLFSCSELSVTGDTAMIIVLYSAEVVHFHH